VTWGGPSALGDKTPLPVIGPIGRPAITIRALPASWILVVIQSYRWRALKDARCTGRLRIKIWFAGVLVASTLNSPPASTVTRFVRDVLGETRQPFPLFGGEKGAGHRVVSGVIKMVAVGSGPTRPAGALRSACADGQSPASARQRHRPCHGNPDGRPRADAL
jgi:hypothetical protein